MHTKRIVTAVLVTASVTVGGVSVYSASHASAADAFRVLGMEDESDWTVEAGTMVGAHLERTEGQQSLEVATDGYTVIRSRLLGPLGHVAERISLDLKMPIGQPNPYWYGAAQLFVSVPSLGLHNAYIGQQDLTGLSLGQFVEIGFAVPVDILEALRGDYADLQFALALNVPQGVQGSYLIDNFQVSESIPERSTISAPDLRRILGMETDADWSSPTSALQSTFSPRTQGNMALAIAPTGYTTITSLPMTAIGPVDPELKLDLWVPSSQPNPNWWGTVQLYVTLPSRGLHNHYIGEHELTGKQQDAFNTLSFTLSSELQAALNSSNYSDLTFTIALNVPEGAAVHYVDNIQVGTATRPAEPALASPRGDLVGRTSSGLLSITREGSAAPEIEDAIFRIKSEDGNCVPAPDQVCRYVISVARIRLGPFTMDGQSIGGLRLRNLDQIRVSIGGSQGNVARIPDGTRFDVGIDLSGGETYIGVFSSFGADISINPAGEGLIALSASFAGRVFDRDTVIQGVVTADTPLRNRMPVADAGPDQSVSSNDCEALVTLDGGNSHDPDGNLSTFTWIWNQRIIAFGQNPTVPLDRSGQWVLQVRVEDSFGSLATDSMVVDVTLPAQCGAL